MARWTQADLERLREAYRLGATRVTFEDRTVEYRSLEDMRTLLSEAEGELGQARDPASRRILPSTRKGL